MQKAIFYLFIFLFCYLYVCFCYGQDDDINKQVEMNGDEKDFVEKYERWFPERVVSLPTPDGKYGPPVSNLPDRLNFGGSGCNLEGNWEFIINFNANPESATSFYNPMFRNKSPFPEFISRISNMEYVMFILSTPRYTVFPMMGRFYYIDCATKINEKECFAAAVRLKLDENPEGVSLSPKSIVFPCLSPKQKKLYEKKDSRFSGCLYKYEVYVKDVQVSNDSKTDHKVNIALVSSGTRRVLRDAWYKVGDAVEFSHYSHKVTNIVAPRMLEKEIRWHKCYFIGYVELDPEAIPLDKPKLDEIEEIIPYRHPSPKPALTEEEKAEMRTWHITNYENKIIEVEAAFIKLENGEVTLRRPDTNYSLTDLKLFSKDDQKLINDIVAQRKQFSAEEGIDFSFGPQEVNSDYIKDGKIHVMKHVIGEDICLVLKIKNVSGNAISVYKRRLFDKDYYNVDMYNKFGELMKSPFVKYKPISFDPKDWITLRPQEEYLYRVPQKKFARWQLPQNGIAMNFSVLGNNRFVYRHRKLDLPLESRKKLVANGTPAKIFVGGIGVFSATIGIEIIPPPTDRKELLLQKAAKYIERTFTKKEVAEILKYNDGGKSVDGAVVDVYSENGKDMIKVFLQLYSLSANELEKFLIKYSEIEGFDRLEFVYRKLAMFNSDESKQIREKMKTIALEKYKKELTDTPIETNDINDDNENDLNNLSEQSVSKSKDNSSKFWIVLIICCFIVTIILVIVIIFRKRNPLKRK